MTKAVYAEAIVGRAEIRVRCHNTRNGSWTFCEFPDWKFMVLQNYPVMCDPDEYQEPLPFSFQDKLKHLSNCRWTTLVDHIRHSSDMLVDLWSAEVRITVHYLEGAEVLWEGPIRDLRDVQYALGDHVFRRWHQP